MATLLRSRRFADRAIEPTQQYITFQLRQYRFALPIERLKRVSQLKGEADAVADLSAPVDAQEEVRWIDLDQCLFTAVNTPAPGGAAIAPLPQAVCVILFSDATGNTVGLAIDTQPKMQRIARSQMLPLLEDKTDLSPIRSICVSQIQMEGENAIFLLDLEKLCTL